MAKQASGSMMSYWRKLFQDNPKLLKLRDNSAIVDRWKQDHPNEKYDKSWSQSLSNVKSLMRNKRKKGRRAKTEAEGAAVSAPANIPQAALERLESAVDHCLWTARNLDAAGLERAIKHLHAARNEIVWKSVRKNLS